VSEVGGVGGVRVYGLAVPGLRLPALFEERKFLGTETSTLARAQGKRRTSGGKLKKFEGGEPSPGEKSRRVLLS